VFGEPWEELRNTDDEVNLTIEPRGAGHHESHERIVVDENGVEWMFSLERFHWAFALINARHWHLPVPENVAEIPPPSHHLGDYDDHSPTEAETDNDVSFRAQPPASMPTEEWMQHQRDMQVKKGEGESHRDGSPLPLEFSDEKLATGNSFLAPVADLLNFGPPCTRGMYNHTTDSFEIIATCPFRQGQEITFWYTDACDDVFMANYGFTMPMLVPKCPNVQDEALTKIRHLSRDLRFAYQQLDTMDQQIDELVAVLHDCHCENQTDYLKARRREDNRSRSSGPPKGPSPTQEYYYDDDNTVDNQDEGYDARRNYPIQVNRNKNDISSHKSRRGSNNNDARHAIRGQGRRSSSKERHTSTLSSPKGRRRPSGASRKSEF
jgi:hypothetical protein